MRTRREIRVAPDHFEVAADDALLTAELRSAIAVCLYDAVEEAGALLHLRFVVRSGKPADVTDTTLATELLLLDRCLEALREAMPGARSLQARIVAQLPDDLHVEKAVGSVLPLVSLFLRDAGVTAASPDIAVGAARRLEFWPVMGRVLIHEMAT
ncbi:MAG: hypothetical protein DIU56_009500 [Pseudomonadota bacterium]|jgi:Chemotaxis protein; stimulates methylation of MCP proteins